MPKPSIHYTLTFVRSTSGSWSFICTRAGRQISECLESYSSLDIIRQRAYAFLCFAVEHYHDRNRFILSEHEVREGKKRNRKFFPILSPNSNLSPAALLKPQPQPKPKPKPQIIPTALADL